MSNTINTHHDLTCGLQPLLTSCIYDYSDTNLKWNWNIEYSKETELNNASEMFNIKDFKDYSKKEILKAIEIINYILDSKPEINFNSNSIHIKLNYDDEIFETRIYNDHTELSFKADNNYEHTTYKTSFIYDELYTKLKNSFIAKHIEQNNNFVSKLVESTMFRRYKIKNFLNKEENDEHTLSKK